VVPGAALVLIGLAPGIERHRVLLEIGAAPVGDIRIADEGLEPRRGRRIGADIKPVLVKGRAEELDLRARRRLLSLADAAEEARPHEAGEKAQDDDDHEELDQ